MKITSWLLFCVLGAVTWLYAAVVFALRDAWGLMALCLVAAIVLSLSALFEWIVYRWRRPYRS